jgi:hypothetical protein
MDVSKYPFEKIFYFIAGVFPGFVALFIFQLASPGAFRWFFTMGFLGYRSKLGLIVLTTFVIGNTITAFLSGLLGAIGGAYGGWKAETEPYVLPQTYSVAPWRDNRWRIALTNRLGTKAPNDTSLLGEGVLKLRREMVGYLPEMERPAALVKLEQEKLGAEIDDSNWAGWYDHYHQIALLDERKDVVSYVRNGLYFNLETAAIYVLISAVWVQSVRRWWCIVPACMWVLALVAQEYSDVRRFMNKWSSLSAQIKYLSESNDGVESRE